MTGEPASGLHLQALAAMGHAVIITDVDGRITFWNAAAENLYGYTAEETLDRDAVDLIVPEDARDLVKQQGGRVSSGLPLTADWDLQDKQGRRFTVHATTTVISDDSDQVVGTLSTSYDVTAQRAMEARANELAAVVEGSDDAILQSGLDGKIRHANRAVEAVFGYTPDEIIGQDIQILVPPGMLDQLTKVTETIIAGRSPGSLLATTRLRKDGTTFDASIRLSPVHGPDGALVGFSGITRDVTADIELRTSLEDSQRRYRARFDRSGMPQAVLDLDGIILSVNDAVCHLLGKDRSEVEGRIWSDFQHATDAGGEQQIRQLSAGWGDAETWERVLLGQDGMPVPVLVQACLLREADGTPYALECFMQDVSGMHRARHELRQSEARYRAIVDTAQEGIWTADLSGNTTYANEKLAEILGLDLETILAGCVPGLLGGADGGALLTDKLLHRQERGAEQYEVEYPHPDGHLRVLRLSVSPLRDETGGTGSLAMITNITDERRAEMELRRRALYDDLTGLPNRSLLTDRLHLAVARSRRVVGSSVAVLFADLDQFKLINDSWGHEAADRLIVAVADRLSAAVRIGDTVARLSGDEFVVIREGASEKDAQELATRLLQALSEPFELGGQRSYITASIGIAVSPASSGAELLRYADAAMHQAKTHGRGRAELFDLSLAGQANGQLSLSNDLRDALTNNELNLYYQPLVELATGRVLGVEALARWNHPTRGPVPPIQFVALAEAMGLASTLDRWALGRACRDLGALRDATQQSLRVSVNLSATHLADVELEQSVLSTLHANGLDCSAIELEITESAIMENPDYSRELLQRLRERGVSIAIDDFGTGYSSLGYLSRLPATTVKIDRGFIQNITADPDSLAIVASIIDLCRAMRLTTVAEGIETVEQLTLLHRLGCTAGQGFLWAPALPLAEFTERLTKLPNRRFDVTRPPRFAFAPGGGEARQVEWPGVGSYQQVPGHGGNALSGEHGVPAAWSTPVADALRAGHLSNRELEIVTLLSGGKRVPAIAAELYLTQGTVRNQLSSIYRKLGLRSQQELIDMTHGQEPGRK